MQILVTGCSGFVGTNLVPRLKALGHTVVGIDRRPLPYTEIDRFIHGDLKAADLVAQGMAGTDLVIHLAAAKDDFGISDEEFFFENVEISRQLIEAGREAGVKDWIFYSSVAAIGKSGADNDNPADEHAPLVAYNAYGASKIEAEALFEDLTQSDPAVRCITIRPAVIYGPGNYHYTNVYRLIEAILNKRFVMVGDGHVVKTMSYIDNMIDATVFLMDHLKPGHQIYTYVDEPPLYSGEIVAHLYEALNVPRPGWHLPFSAAKSVASVADVAARVTGINFPITAARIKQFCTPTSYSANAIRALGFTQRMAPRDALDATVRWHLDHRTVNA